MVYARPCRATSSRIVANAGPTTVPFWTCDWLIARNCSSIITPNFTISPMNIGLVALEQPPRLKLVGDPYARNHCRLFRGCRSFLKRIAERTYPSAKAFVADVLTDDAFVLDQRVRLEFRAELSKSDL
jgi:hypothetical protein